MRRLLTIVMSAVLLCGCGGNPKAVELLARADSLMDVRPDSALTVLNEGIAVMDDSPESLRMRYRLLQAKAQNKAFLPFTSDSLMLAVADYYDRHGTANERMEAHYLLGCVYRDLGDAPQAMSQYHSAVSMADTTSKTCDYALLRLVYSQMSAIYHQQHLPYNEISSLQKFVFYTYKTGNTLNSIQAEGTLVRPYYLLGKKDTVLQIINENFAKLRKLGYNREAADFFLGTAIYIYTERGQLEDARRLIQIHEKESGLFDSLGNVCKGRESYYWIKGFYELSARRIDEAESLFRKAINKGSIADISNGYKGLLRVFQQKEETDSIIHYSQLSEMALDSLHSQLQIEAIHNASALYNYTLSQKKADEEKQKRIITVLWFWVFFIFTTILLVTVFFVFMKVRRRRTLETRALNKALASMRAEADKTKSELQILKGKDYESLIKAKEEKEKLLTLRISELEAEIETKGSPLPVMRNRLDDFEKSAAVKLFRDKALFTREHPVPNKAEWNFLISQFRQDMPTIYQEFNVGKKLSPLELRTCVLLILDFDEQTIVGLTQTQSPSVSTAKSRANMKLFKEKSATTLKYNLEKLVGRI